MSFRNGKITHEELYNVHTFFFGPYENPIVWEFLREMSLFISDGFNDFNEKNESSTVPQRRPSALERRANRRNLERTEVWDLGHLKMDGNGDFQPFPMERIGSSSS